MRSTRPVLRHVALPALAPAALVGLFFTPVMLFGCVNRGLLALAQNGNGTVGKLLTDSLLYRDIRHTVASMDSLLADIKANPKKYINLRIF